MKRSGWLVLAATLAVVPSLAGAQAVVTERTLSLNAAIEMATAALEHCRNEGFSVTITVLNRAGRTKIVMHDDRANPHTLENSLRKAYTSLTFRVPSGDYGKRIAANPPPHPTLHFANVTTAAGGLPVISNKEVIGAIGVSGGAGGAKDALCAKAGIDKIAASLN